MYLTELVSHEPDSIHGQLHHTRCIYNVSIILFLPPAGLRKSLLQIWSIFPGIVKIFLYMQSSRRNILLDVLLPKRPDFRPDIRKYRLKLDLLSFYQRLLKNANLQLFFVIYGTGTGSYARYIKNIYLVGTVPVLGEQIS